MSESHYRAAVAHSRLAKAVTALAGLVAFVCIAFGALHPLLGDWNSDGDRIIFAVLVCGGGVLIVAGLALFLRSPWLAATLVTVGAAAGALGLFWTALLPILAVTLGILSFRWAASLAAPLPG